MLLILAMQITRHFAMQAYVERCCMGIRWRRRFPKASKESIREFLTIFVDAFEFNQKERTFFGPDDRLADIFKAKYPLGSFDSMEMETLIMALEERYGVDFEPVWNRNTTLGDLFEHACKR